MAYTALLEKQQALVNRLKETLQSKEEYIANLMEMLVKSRKTIYGQSSEKERCQKQKDSLQLALFNEAEAEALASLAPAEDPISVSSYQCKPKRSNEELMKGLPVKQVIIALPEEEKVCPICRSELQLLGQEVKGKGLPFLGQRYPIG